MECVTVPVVCGRKFFFPDNNYCCDLRCVSISGTFLLLHEVSCGEREEFISNAGREKGSTQTRSIYELPRFPAESKFSISLFLRNPFKLLDLSAFLPLTILLRFQFLFPRPHSSFPFSDWRNFVFFFLGSSL